MGHPATYPFRVVRTNALRAGNVDPRMADTTSLGELFSSEAGLPEVAAYQRIVFGLHSGAELAAVAMFPALFAG